MAPEKNHLNRLVELAKEPSSERRRDLMREVTDLFLEDPTSYSQTENDHFGEILAHVAKEVEVQVRAELADKMADVPSAPGGLVKQLAEDDAIEVADPVLKRSKTLSEDDLLDIVKNKGGGHALAVSCREEVSENLSDALVETGNEEVMVSLVENKGAQFSRHTMEKVVDKSETIPALQSPLVARTDLPPEMMNEMFFFVSKQVKEQILHRNGELDERTIADVIAASKEKFVHSLEKLAAANEKKAARHIESLFRLKQLNERKLLEYLNNDQQDLFVFTFAKLGELDPKTARRIVANPDCEAIAVVSKACSFDRSTFSTLVMKCGSQRTVQPDELNGLLRLYDQVPVETAQRTMRFWRVRQKVMADDSGQGAAVA